ncbi:pyruvate kinase [Acetobacteroides hydrogenigenes]|nr:pyruvate kinase [Acetobacteroides hydrogenigenes]
MLKKTKIVATISDRRCDIEFIRQLYEAGMDVVRLNTAHQTPEDSTRVIENVRAVSEKIAILVDTKGPEVRTCKMKDEENIVVKHGDKLKFKGDSNGLSFGDTVYVSYNDFVKDIPVGSSILVDDGELAFLVIDKNDEYLFCESQDNGTLKGKKSVNVPGVQVKLPALSDKDIDFIHWAIDNDIDFIAHSFVRNKHDLMAIQRILDEKNSNVKIISKIENQEGVENIEEILNYSYGIMVARGDLGVELPAEQIPVVQRKLIRAAMQMRKPVIIATQMLHTMIDNPRPTRAEVSDIANAIYQRTDAIMLSGETAYGKYPIDAVKTMSRVAVEIEKHLNPEEEISYIRVNNEITAQLARSAVKASLSLPIKAVIIDTNTGRTGRYMAAFRGKLPVFAKCYKKRVVRELALSYGVYSEYFSPRESRDEFIRDAVKIVSDKGKFNPEDLIIVVGGSFGKNSGASFMEISNVKNMTGGE